MPRHLITRFVVPAAIVFLLVIIYLAAAPFTSRASGAEPVTQQTVTASNPSLGTNALSTTFKAGAALARETEPPNSPNVTVEKIAVDERREAITVARTNNELHDRASRDMMRVPNVKPKQNIRPLTVAEHALGLCPSTAPVGTLRDGVDKIGIEVLCRYAITHAATPQAAAAILWTLQQLGTPYACDGVGRTLPRRFDCSSLVARAYWEAAGVPLASADWSPSTRDMTPWDGVPLDPHYKLLPPDQLLPGDLALYGTCTGPSSCTTGHVVMYLGKIGGVEWMVHTNHCGDVTHVKRFRGVSSAAGFVMARRVVFLPGERLIAGI